MYNATSTPKDFYTEIKYEWIRDKIIVPVQVGGTTYRFILDTGAPTIISPKIFSEAKTEWLLKLNIGDANGKSDSLSLVSIPQIQLGNVIYTKVPALVNSEIGNKILECMGVDGLIGSNLLANSIIQILPKARKIILTDKESKLNLKRRYRTALKFHNEQRSPFIEIKLSADGRMMEELLVDMGMEGFYDMAEKNMAIFLQNNALKVSATGIGSMGSGLFGAEDTAQYSLVHIPSLSIGKVKFSNILTSTTKDQTSRIGSDILKHGEVTLDYVNSQFYYKAFADTTADLNESNFGYLATMLHDKYVVGIVWDPELKDKLHYGDEILHRK